MDNKEIIKRKNDLFRSIMGNPKLSKTFSEAMSAPIGSTKRKQAKSVLSIMKKVGGHQDGRGGLMDSFNTSAMGTSPFGMMSQSTSSSLIPPPNNTNNLVILPAAPTIKSTAAAPVKAPTPTKITVPKNYFSSPASTTAPIQATATSTPSSSTWPSLSSSFATGTPNIPTTNMSTTAPSVSVATPPQKSAPSYSPGIIPSIPSIAKAGLTLGEGVLGGAQYLGQNALAGAQRGVQWLSGALSGEFRDSEGNLTDRYGNKIPQVPFTSFSNTWGGKKASEYSLFQPSSVPNLVSSVQAATTPSSPTPTTPTKTTSSGTVDFATLFGGGTKPTESAGAVKAPSSYSGVTSAVQTGTSTAKPTTGYDGSIVPGLSNKKVSDLTDDEKVQLFKAQQAREGSTLKNNPFGIKIGGSTQHWITDGKAKPGVMATDGGQFLEFNDGATALQAYGELLYGPNYADLTVDDAMKRWSGATTGAPSEVPETKPFVGITAEQYQKLSPAERTAYDSSAAKDAIKRGVGKEAFALEQTPLQFGGNLNQLVVKQKEELRTEHGLDQMEQELSDLKSKRENFIPTLSKYITGRDEYLTKVDKAITDWEDTRKTLDMGDPTVNASYRKHLAYLYTLRGRQAERYGNFLKSAVSDYEADVADLQSRYDIEYARYQDDVTSGAAISQETYNSRLQGMASLYAEFDGAEAKALNMKLLQDQSDNNEILKKDNLSKSSDTSDPDYMKDYDATLKKIADNDGNLEIESIGVSGIYGLFATAAQAGLNTNAVTDAINKAVSMTLRAKDSNDPTKIVPGTIEKVKQVKAMIDDFSERMNATDDAAGKAAARALRDNFAMKSSQPLLKDYVIENLEAIKAAIKELTNKKGAPTQRDWLSNHSDLDYDLMSSLYTYLVAAMQQAIAAKPELTPSEFLAPAITGTDDQIAQAVSGAITAGW